MPGKTLQPVAAVFAPDIRGALHAHVDVPAPGVIDGHAGQLREHPFQIGPGGTGHIRRDAAQVGAAAAEQQAVVRGQAEIVGDELVVDHAAVLRQQRRRQLRVERRGGHLIGTHRQQTAGQATVEAVDVGVAGQHDLVGAHLAPLGTGHIALALFAVAEHAALFEQPAAALLDGRRQALGQLERIEVAGLRIVQRGLVTLAADPLGQLIAADQAQLVIAPLVLRLFQRLGEHADTARQHGRPQAAGPVVDVKAMALRQLTDFLGGPDHAVPQAPGAGHAERLLQRRHIARPAQQRLAAIAPGSGPGQTAGFQHDHLLAGGSQTQRRVQAAETAADDQHVGLQGFLQGAAQRDAAGESGGVVTGNVLSGLFEHGTP